MVSATAGPLDGLRVVEVGTHRAGAFAGAILADLGAEVVKVEPPLPADDGPATDRLVFDRGKRSVAVDLDRPQGRDVLARLVARGDVLLDELAPAELSRLGLDGARLVHCSISPFGPAPAADVPATHPGCEDLLVQALSGNMDLTGEAGGPPFELGIPLGDLGAGVYAAIGVLGALVGGAAEIDGAGGSGTRVEIAKLDVAVALLSYMAVGWFADGEVPTRVGTGHSTIFPYNAFRARDGEVVVAPFTSRFWRNFATAIGREDLTHLDSYRHFAGRLENKDALTAIFTPILAQRTVADWLAAFAAADVPCGPVLTVAGALELDHTVERGLTPSFVDGDGTRVRTAGSPFRFRFADGTTYVPQVTRPPRVGEHTESLLAGGRTA